MYIWMCSHHNNILNHMHTTETILLPDRGLSFSMEEWPTLYEMGRDILTLAITHEFGFYMTHRLMHSTPFLYQFHKVHHEYKQNNVLSAQHFHPVDYFISIGGPAVLATTIVKPHSFTQFVFGVWLLTANFDDHLGYNFPWSPVSIVYT
jgi:sterol desaturase/sphingolipid hydroxylase (fatty acid hydroxylase superfamily)